MKNIWKRAKWTENVVSIPSPNSLGHVAMASGFFDGSSVEYGAYLFFPNGDENGYYCSFDDFKFID